MGDASILFASLRDRPGRAIGWAALLLFVPVCFQPGWLVLPLLGALLLGLSFFRYPGDTDISRTARLLLCFLVLYWTLAGHLFFWPLHFLVPLMLAGLTATLLGDGTAIHAAVRRGQLDNRVWLGIGAIILASVLCLSAWVALAAPDLSAMARMIPALPPPALLGLGLGFAIINAALEEVIWRGVLQTWLSRFLRPGAAIAVQAISFGLAHWKGFPSGPEGVVLATIYGALLGVLALRSGGLLAPILAHIGADLVVFAFLVGAGS